MQVMAEMAKKSWAHSCLDLHFLITAYLALTMAKNIPHPPSDEKRDMRE